MKHRINELLNISVILLSCTIQTSSITISPCAKWETNGLTILGTGTAGNSSEELNEPASISFHQPTQQLYIADHKNARVQMLKVNQPVPIVQSVATNLYFPLHIYVDDESVQVGEECHQCFGVAVDNDKNVYISDALRDRILKWSKDLNTTTIVAGVSDQPGIAPNLLRNPHGLYVTRNGSYVYAVDTGNSRIQKWAKDAREGVTIIGSSNGTAGNDSTSLRNPISVFVDEITNIIYVADTDNHRVMRWLPNMIKGEIIAGTGTQGNSSHQLNVPNDITFDMDGNLYVSDFNNHRIQVFRLIDNQSCSSLGKLAMSVTYP
ncbi:hypothetical protein I4U23_006245 [Adineta vaga]|nr:hypothetical protein I4U23_006245 [Adineta vaga]